jgi:peptidoglycan/LPS O-acetylase OafA/YrhL
LYVCKALDKRLLGGQIAQNPSSAVVVIALLAIIAAALVFVLVEEPSRRRIPRLLLRGGVLQTATARADGSNR